MLQQSSNHSSLSSISSSSSSRHNNNNNNNFHGDFDTLRTPLPQEQMTTSTLPYSPQHYHQHHHNQQQQQQQQQRRGWTIALFSITTLLLFADQNLMSPNLSDMAEEFGFDDEERDRKLGGDISLAFFLLGAPASIVIGFLTDSSDRSVVFAWTVFIGEGACLATYWVSTYSQLYFCRAITGFSVGGAVPLIYSILGDLFAAEDRHVVSALVSFGTGAGIAVGQAIAGYLGPAYGWRLPFLIVAIPALVTASLVLFTVPDPPRGAMEAASRRRQQQRLDDNGHGESGVALVTIQSQSDLYVGLTTTPPSPPPQTTTATTAMNPHDKLSSVPNDDSNDDHHLQYHNPLVDECMNLNNICDETYATYCGQDVRHFFQTFRILFRTPTVLLAVLQGAPGCITWGIINVFLNDFLSENRGFTVEMATTTLMFFSLGHAVGLFSLGGGMAQKLYRTDKRYPSVLAGGTAISGCFPLWLLFNKVDVSTPYWIVIVIAALAGFGSGPTGPIIKATLTNVTLPRARGQAFAFFNLFDDFGKGLGPFFVSLLISRMGGRLPAFNVGIFGWVICGVANLAIFFFVERDEALIQAEIAMTTSSSSSSSSRLSD